MATKTQFPKQIYVAKEQDKETEWFMADDSAEALAVMHDDREIGIYALVRVAKITNKSQVK